MPAPFSIATSVSPDDAGPDRYRAHLPEPWSTPSGVHGGMLAATALRAAQRASRPPDLRLRIAHVVFLARPSNDVSFEVSQLRSGRSSAHLRVSGTCAQQDRPAVDVTAVFTADAESPSWTDVEPPEVPGPLGAAQPPAGQEPMPPPMGPIRPPPLFDQLEIRPVLGEVPWSEGWTPGQRSRHVRWGRLRETPFLDDGTVDPLVALPFADLPGPAFWVRSRPGEMPPFFMSLDLSITFLEPIRDEWLLSDIRAKVLTAGHAYVETDLWSAGRLVAVSNQTMLLRRDR